MLDRTASQTDWPSSTYTPHSVLRQTFWEWLKPILRACPIQGSRKSSPAARQPDSAVGVLVSVCSCVARPCFARRWSTGTSPATCSCARLCAQIGCAIVWLHLVSLLSMSLPARWFGGGASTQMHVHVQTSRIQRVKADRVVSLSSRDASISIPPTTA